MKRFPLQGVLNYRLHLEEQAQSTYALRLLDCKQAQENVDSAISQRIQLCMSLETMKIAAEIDSNAILAVQRQLDHMNEHVIYLKQIVKQVEEIAQQAHTALISACKDRQVIEHLRDKFKEQAIAEELYAESVELGEVALLQWHTRRQEISGDPS
jgi:flagellar export protein FliJ